MTETKAEKIAGELGAIVGNLAARFAVFALKAWLLVLVLGWFGVTVLGFWKAAVVVLLIDLVLFTAKPKKFN
jgi:hypothetical protein